MLWHAYDHAEHVHVHIINIYTYQQQHFETTKHNSAIKTLRAVTEKRTCLWIFGSVWMMFVLYSHRRSCALCSRTHFPQLTSETLPSPSISLCLSVFFLFISRSLFFYFRNLAPCWWFRSKCVWIIFSSLDVPCFASVFSPTPTYRGKWWRRAISSTP